MGQYYKKDRKIGTCESMYYMRRAEAQELARIGEKDDDGVSFKEYLTDNVTRWRFPWPSEDIDSTLPRDMDGGRLDLINKNPYEGQGFTVPASALGRDEIQHTRLCMPMHDKKGVQGFNVFIPCPYSQAFKDQGITTSTGAPVNTPRLRVVAEADREDPPADSARALPTTRSLYTIFACAICDSNQRFDHDSTAKIKEEARREWDYLNPEGKTPDWHDRHPDAAQRYAEAMETINRIN